MSERFQGVLRVSELRIHYCDVPPFISGGLERIDFAAGSDEKAAGGDCQRTRSEHTRRRSPAFRTNPGSVRFAGLGLTVKLRVCSFSCWQSPLPLIRLAPLPHSLAH